MFLVIAWIGTYATVALFLLATCGGVRVAAVKCVLTVATFPVLLLLKACGVEARQLKRVIFTRAHYAVAGFYFILFAGSLISLFVDYFTVREIRLPRLDLEKYMLRWGSRVYDEHVMSQFPAIMCFLQLCLHVTSVISFCTALSASRGSSGCRPPVHADGILYGDDEKPPRASYCRYCDATLQRRDHHCIWIGYCVYEANLLPFNVFLASTGVACALKALYDWYFLRTAYCAIPGQVPYLCELPRVVSFPIQMRVSWFISCFPVEVVSILMHTLIAVMLIPFSAFHLVNYIYNLTQDETRTLHDIRREIKRNPAANLYCLTQQAQQKQYLHYLNRTKIANHRPQVLIFVECNAEFCNFCGHRYILMSKASAIAVLRRYSPFRKRGNIFDYR